MAAGTRTQLKPPAADQGAAEFFAAGAARRLGLASAISSVPLSRRLDHVEVAMHQAYRGAVPA